MVKVNTKQLLSVYEGFTNNTTRNGNKTSYFYSNYLKDKVVVEKEYESNEDET